MISILEWKNNKADIEMFEIDLDQLKISKKRIWIDFKLTWNHFFLASILFRWILIIFNRCVPPVSILRCIFRTVLHSQKTSTFGRDGRNKPKFDREGRNIHRASGPGNFVENKLFTNIKFVFIIYSPFKKITNHLRIAAYYFWSYFLIVGWKIIIGKRAKVI